MFLVWAVKTYSRQKQKITIRTLNLKNVKRLFLLFHLCDVSSVEIYCKHLNNFFNKLDCLNYEIANNKKV